MSDERIYVGNAKKITTQYGDLMKLSLTAEDVEKMQQNLDNGWINVVIKERRSPSAGGMTHYLEVDKWKPEPRNGEDALASSGTPSSSPSTPEPSVEDLPF